MSKQKTILVSGASGLVGYGITRSLQELGHKLIGTTIYENSPADCFSDIVEIAPKTNDDNYIDWLLETIREHNVDIIIPSIEADMLEWNKQRKRLEGTGTVVMLNNSELINLCEDKWKFYNKLVETKPEYAIESRIEGNFKTLSKDFGLPFLLKPRRGSASQGIKKIENQADFNEHKQFLGITHIAQAFIGDNDHEYTVSAFFCKESKLLCYQQLKRTLSKQGYTETAESAEINDIEKCLMDIAEVFKPIGPTNFQFRYSGKQIKLLEINPRISSATSIRKAFGYNESKMCIEYFLENITPQMPALKKGKAIRYVEDYIF